MNHKKLSRRDFIRDTSLMTAATVAVRHSAKSPSKPKTPGWNSATSSLFQSLTIQLLWKGPVSER